jgi:hypothetical protein
MTTYELLGTITVKNLDRYRYFAINGSEAVVEKENLKIIYSYELKTLCV